VTRGKSGAPKAKKMSFFAFMVNRSLNPASHALGTIRRLVSGAEWKCGSKHDPRWRVQYRRRAAMFIAGELTESQ
jgi:hypothetical protein